MAQEEITSLCYLYIERCNLTLPYLDYWYGILPHVLVVQGSCSVFYMINLVLTEK